MIKVQTVNLFLSRKMFLLGKQTLVTLKAKYFAKFDPNLAGIACSSSSSELSSLQKQDLAF